MEYTRLPFGIKTGPSLFQREMEKTLRDVPQARAFIDDVVIGTNEPTLQLTEPIPAPVGPDGAPSGPMRLEALSDDW